MKKLFVSLLAAIFLATPVFAIDENTVYLREEDGQIVYEASDGFDERFMHHEGMVPGGETYTDYLTIENGTSTDYDIYFKITAENNSTKANGLIDNIDMKIYIDDELFYDGKARGQDYRKQGINLTNAIKIKEFATGESVRMKVETRLNEAYEDINNSDTSKTHWHFYAIESGLEPTPTPIEPEEIPQSPKTHDDFSPWLVVLFGLFATVLFTVIFRDRKAKRLAKK
ncbi:MAG: hypothetical protein MJ154_02945 [Candidatus Saccharibacteria bacterium]|nr:hypothetical protein [Candidatus Saccharibacteria bacterium]